MFRCIISLCAVIGAGIYFCVSKANYIFFGMALLLDMNIFFLCVCCKLFFSRQNLFPGLDCVSFCAFPGILGGLILFSCNNTMTVNNTVVLTLC